MADEKPYFRTVLMHAWERLVAHESKRSGKAYIIGDDGYVQLIYTSGIVEVPNYREKPYGDLTRREFVEYAIGQGNYLGFLPASPDANKELVEDFGMVQNDIGFLEPKDD